MTNDELNRRVATLRGWTFADEDMDWGLRPLTPTIRNPNGLRVDASPDYATDPAAWGALYQELAATGMDVSLNHPPNASHHCAFIGDSVVFDPLPGRALCLAFVASQEEK